jgi:putative nucleotidyltransferase with HDIG domain
MNDQSNELSQLLAIIENVAGGNYSNDIMALTGSDVPGPIRIIAEAMGMMMVKVETREYQLELLVQELRSLNEQIKRNSLQTVSSMAQALEARDAYTRGHAERVAGIAALIACEMGLAPVTVELVRTAGVLHDIGKIGCSDRIFQPHEARNPPDVVKEIMAHPGAGAEILKHLDFLGEVVTIIHAHHERIDGKGYPRRMKGNDIPLGARIIAVADGYDAMTTDRPYQKGMTHQAALEILRGQAGAKWDADCVAAFERLQVIAPAQEQPDEGEPTGTTPPAQ